MTQLQEILDRRRHEAGSGRIGAILALIAIVALIYFLVLYVPVRINNAALEQEAEELTRSYVVGNIKGEEALLEQIVEAARELDIGLTEEQVQIDDGSRFVTTRIRYGVPVAYVWGEKTHSFDVEVEVPKI